MQVEPNSVEVIRESYSSRRTSFCFAIPWLFAHAAHVTTSDELRLCHFSGVDRVNRGVDLFILLPLVPPGQRKRKVEESCGQLSDHHLGVDCCE